LPRAAFRNESRLELVPWLIWTCRRKATTWSGPKARSINAMCVCRGLLLPGGFLAFTDAVRRKKDPPPEVKASFDPDYPTMGTGADVETAIQLGGFELFGRFTLPDEAWWDDFYSWKQFLSAAEVAVNQTVTGACAGCTKEDGKIRR